MSAGVQLPSMEDEEWFWECQRGDLYVSNKKQEQLHITQIKMMWSEFEWGGGE